MYDFWRCMFSADMPFKLKANYKFIVYNSVIMLRAVASVGEV